MGRLTQVTVVTMLACIEHANLDGLAFKPCQLGCETSSEMVSLGEHSDQNQIVDAAVALCDLVGDAGKGPSDLFRVHYGCLQPFVNDAHQMADLSGTA
jgi:hypothetical protein